VLESLYNLRRRKPDFSERGSTLKRLKKKTFFLKLRTAYILVMTPCLFAAAVAPCTAKTIKKSPWKFIEFTQTKKRLFWKRHIYKCFC